MLKRFVLLMLVLPIFGNENGDETEQATLLQVKIHDDYYDYDEDYDYDEEHKKYFVDSLDLPTYTVINNEDDGPEVWLNTYEKDGDICEFAALCLITSISDRKVHPFLSIHDTKNAANLVADCAGKNSNYDHITSNWRSANKLQGLDQLKQVAPWVGKTDSHSSQNCYESAYSYNKLEADCTLYKNKQDENKRCYK
jgi:hypothetical protein